MLDVDPVALVRNRRGPAGERFALEQYVNDRPYVASSFLSVAFAKVFGAALAGTSRERSEPAAGETAAAAEARAGSLIYRDNRIAGFDAAAVVEVVEHLDEPRLVAFERVLFEFAKPRTVVLTTPNVEYNVRFENLPAGRLRHKDHRFEWTRRQFQEWAQSVAERFGYALRFLPVGPEDAEVGPPTQMAVFSILLKPSWAEVMSARFHTMRCVGFAHGNQPGAR